MKNQNLKLSSRAISRASHLALPTLVAVATLAHPAQAFQPQMNFNLYGSIDVHSMNTYTNVQDFTPTRRWYSDLQQLTLEPEIAFSPKLELEAEIEIEHGGVGSSLEFDGFEEFGEFESEVDQGGEVKLETIQLTYKAKNWFNFKVGYIPVPVGWSSLKDLPEEYFTTDHGRTESHIIPASWREVGIGATGEIGNFVYEYDLVSALNSEFFRKYDWVAGAAERRFETEIAQAWASAFRFDYGFARDQHVVGFSIYYGDSTPNRHKPAKLDVPSGVLIGDIHGMLSYAGFLARAVYLRGTLQNADQIGQANSSLAGLASPGGFSSVGKEAEAGYIEVGYDLSRLFPSSLPQKFTPFVRFDHWDTMKVAPANGVRDARFREKSFTAGINLNATRDLIVKAQYAQVQPGLKGLPQDHQIALGLGFKYFSAQNQGDENDVIY